MKAFIFGVVTVAILAAGSAVVLQTYVQKPATQAFSTDSVRV